MFGTRAANQAQVSAATELLAEAEASLEDLTEPDIMGATEAVLEVLVVRAAQAAMEAMAASVLGPATRELPQAAVVEAAAVALLEGQEPMAG